MKASSIVTIAALSFAALSACRQEAAAEPLDLRTSMQQQVNPAALAIWDVGNNAMNDAGGIDAALMDDAKWGKLAEAAGQLSAAGKAIAAATSFSAAAADNSAVGQGEIAMAEVQRHVDSDTDGFRRMGAALAAHADKLSAAAKAKDAAQAGELVSQMDAVCESCHSRYWYPD
jgi:cytochrome c556